MKLLSVTTNNFKVLKGTRSYIIPTGLIGISGNNGIGKSTFLNAVAYALYGPDMIPGGKKEMVTWGEDKGMASAEFDLEGTTYVVERSLGDASLTELTANGPITLAKGLDPTTRLAEKLLGVDRVGFLVSVFSKQEELAGLSSLQSASRMRTVLRLLGIDQLTSSVEKLRNEAKLLRRGIDIWKLSERTPAQIREELDGVSTLIDTTSAKIVEEERTAASQEQQTLALEETYDALLIKRQEWEAYQAALTPLRREQAESEGALRSAQEALGRPQPADPGPVPPLPDPDEGSRLSERRGFLMGQIESLNESIANSACPFCKRVYEDTDAHNLALELVKYQDALKLTTMDIAAYVESEGARHDYERRQIVMANYLQRQQEARAWLQGAVERSHQLIENMNLIPTAEDPTAEIEIVLRKINESILASGRLGAGLAGLRQQAHDLTSRHESLAHDLRRAEAAADNTAAERRLLSATELAAGEMGKLKEEMIGRVIPSLNDRASQLIDEMTDGRYTELTLTPDYEIQFRNYMGELKDFEVLSGGERDVFALALRLALSEVRADRIGVLILDEVMESLDTERQELVWTALLNLTSRYHQIFVVTHLPDLKSRAPQELLV